MHTIVRRRVLRLASLLAAASWFWVTSGPAVQAADAPKDQLVIGITQFPATLNPLIESMIAKNIVLGLGHRPLTVHDADWQLVCLLCTELPTFSNGLAQRVKLPGGKDGLKVTVTLQPTATWGDGTPVTTRDVLFTWAVGRHPQSGVAEQNFFKRMTAIEARDEKTFTVTYEKPIYSYNNFNDFMILPAHLEKPVFDANPSEYRNKTLYLTRPTERGLWFGPYRLTESVTGSHLVLEKNPSWWGPAAEFKQIRVRAIENTAALEQNLLSGDVDMVAGELGIEVDQGLGFEERNRQRFQIIFKPSLVYEHIDFNLDNPILQDVRVRRALLMSIDREGLTKSLFGGYQPVANSFTHPLDWIFDEKTPVTAFDPVAAGKLLDQAGFSQRKNGVRVDAKGRALSFELMTTAGNKTRERVQQVLQAQWKQVGVDVKIRNQIARVFFAETVTRRKFTGMAMYAWLSAPESDQRMILHSDNVPSPANNWGGQNFGGWKNPKADALIDKIDGELDVDSRFRLWSELQRLYASEVPVLPLFYQADMHILPLWLDNVVPTGNQYPTTLWVETWKVKK